MLKSTPYRFVLLFMGVIATALMLSACGSSELNLAGEPQIVATLPPQPTPLPQLGYPEAPPNLANGAAIFAENCVECHGPNGQGNGELVNAGDVPYPGDMTSWAAVSVDTPADWYDMVTNGNLAKLMPPWINSLSEQERWDVAHYAYTLSHTPETLAQGQAIYERECAACHGMEGNGDGPRAIEEGLEPGALSLARSMVTLSDDAVYINVVEGIGTSMPAFGDELSEEEMQAVTQYVRTLALSDEAPVETAETVEAEATPDMPESIEGAVSGDITNGTEGASVPDGIGVSLYVFDTFFNQTEQLETTTSDGSYQFDDITLERDFTYVAVVEHEKRRFISNPVRIVDTTDPNLMLPVEIYEITTDPDVIEIENIAAQISVQEEQLQIIQVVSYRNTSDKLFSTDEAVNEEETIFTSVQLSLPPGALIAGFPDSAERYVVAEDNSTIQDTQPLLPGLRHDLQVVYFLPFERDAIIEHPLDYPLNGVARLLVSPMETGINTEQLTEVGEAVINNAAYNEFVNMSLVLPSGDAFRYEVVRARGGTVSLEGSLPLILFIISGATAGGAITLFVLNRRGNNPKQQLNQQIDTLVARIADLDAQHDSGQLNHDAWHQQRDALKAELAKLLQQRGDKS